MSKKFKCSFTKKLGGRMATRRAIETMQESIASLVLKLSVIVDEQNARLLRIEKELKDQRDDYHGHIRQLVAENETAHKNFSAELSHVLDIAQESSNQHSAELKKFQNETRALAQDIAGIKEKMVVIIKPKKGY